MSHLHIHRMEQAIAHLDLILDDLDLSEETCECCSARKYTNFDDYQLGKKLSGMIQKLNNEIKKKRTT